MMKDSEWKKLIKHSHVAGIRTGQVVCAVSHFNEVYLEFIVLPSV